jgi:endo-1,4-beta-xylanase
MMPFDGDDMMKHAFWLAAVLGTVSLCGCSVLVSIPSSDLQTGGGGNTPGGGATASGGVASEGGTSNAGDATLTGGAQSTGGTAAAGGITSTDGTAAAGGITSAGDAGVTGADAGTGDAGVTPVKFIGNIPSSNGDVVRDGFANYWNQIVPENVGKWGLVQSNSKDQFDWSALDALYKYANDHNLIFKQHNFFCGNQQPDWVTEANVAEAGEAWVKAFCQRYPKTKLIDVVNEPSHYTPKYINGMGGSGTSGYDWVVTAYKWARKYCPNAELIINDYNILEYDNHHSKFMTMMQALLAAGAPIDAIGAEGHDTYLKNTDRVKLRLDDLTTTGLPVYITEYDINLADDTQQLNSMMEQIQMFWDDPNVKGITYWGYAIDSNYKLWRDNTYLVNLDGTFRPAMTWLQEFIHSH